MSEPIGYIVGVGAEDPFENVMFTTDRAEAHRVFANLSALDERVVERSNGEITDSLPTALTNVYDERALYEFVVQAADDVQGLT